MLVYNPNSTTPDKIEPLFALTFHGVNPEHSKQPVIDGITLHQVVEKTIQEGRYLNASEVKEWVNDCVIQQQGNSSNGYIKADCIAQTSSHFCFFQPSFVGRMWFRIKKPVSLKVTYPALLYVVHKQKRKLKIVALDSDNRPTLDSNVYIPPLMNIDSNSDLCIGNATLPDIRDESSIKEIVDSLTASNFTHVNTNITLSASWRKRQKKTSVTTTDLFNYWKARGTKKPLKSDLTFMSSLNDYLNEAMND